MATLTIAISIVLSAQACVDFGHSPASSFRPHSWFKADPLWLELLAVPSLYGISPDPPDRLAPAFLRRLVPLSVLVFITRLEESSAGKLLQPGHLALLHSAWLP